MDRPRGPSLASPVQNVNKPESSPRPRKKLQKSSTKQRVNLARRPGSVDSMANKFDTGVKLVAHQAGVIGQPTLRLPPDLSDSKWLEYLRRSGLVCALDSPLQSTHTLDVPAAAADVPELAHLSISNAQPRTSLDRLSSPDSPTSSSSTMSTMRRRAKTPVLAIGQLEGYTFGREAATAKKTTSVDLIAEQYIALLESQDDDANSIYTNSHSEPAPSRLGYDDVDHGMRRLHSSDDALLQPPPLLGDALALSPTSDDGTLVAFEEETIYFKPRSFSPEPASPLRNYERAYPRSPSPQPDNLSLQICMDLLTRELASAMSGRHLRSGNEAPALQIWVMIEAYEQLRDQVLEMRTRHDDLRSVELMFDSWLGALYSIHDAMTGHRRTNESESDYDDIIGLESEDVD